MDNNSNNQNQEFIYEDITSNSPTASNKEKAKKIAKPIVKYADGIFKHLGNVIKAIGFLIGFGIFGVCLFLGYYLYSKDPTFKLVSLAIITAGIVLGMIIMFLIFGLGHIICQNNEILRRLNRLEEDK